jgi:hypothetical protein
MEATMHNDHPKSVDKPLKVRVSYYIPNENEDLDPKQVSFEGKQEFDFNNSKLTIASDAAIWDIQDKYDVLVWWSVSEDDAWYELDIVGWKDSQLKQMDDMAAELLAVVEKTFKE